MPVNLNPPPLPTPDTARSAQPLSQATDDTVSADLFAQLVAAATTTTKAAASINSSRETVASDDKPDKTHATNVDTAALDLVLALGAIPLAAPVAALTDRAATPATDSTDATARRPATPHVERHAARAIDVEAARTPQYTERAVRGDSQALAIGAALREQVASALAPRQAPSPLSPSAASDPRERVATNVGPARAPAANATPIAAVLAAAIERDRVPDHVTSERPLALDALASPPAPSPAPASQAAAAPPTPITIDTPVGAPDFGEEVATKVAHVVLRADRAELRLSPAELGPVDIRIDFKSDSASLTIVAAQPATRDALEQALPLLRESLAAQGIALGQAAIHDGRTQSERRFTTSDTASPRGADADGGSPVLATGRVRLSDRLVDTFA